MAVSFFFFKQKTAYDVRISDWSSDVCSSDLTAIAFSNAWRVRIWRGRTSRRIAAPSASADRAALSVFSASSAAMVGEYRSEERRFGKDRVRQCRSRWLPYHDKNNINHTIIFLLAHSTISQTFNRQRYS